MAFRGAGMRASGPRLVCVCVCEKEPGNLNGMLVHRFSGMGRRSCFALARFAPIPKKNLQRETPEMKPEHEAVCRVLQLPRPLSPRSISPVVSLSLKL